MPRWPEGIDDVWAKSPAKSARVGETLAEHTWLALERLADLSRLRPDLPQSLGLPPLWQVLYLAVFLHDFGKCARGFQKSLRGRGRWPHRHEVLSLAFVDWVAAELNPEEQVWLAAAIVSHHKDADDINELYPPPDELYDDRDPLEEVLAEIEPSVVRGLHRWLVQFGPEWAAELGLPGVSGPTVAAEGEALAGFFTNGAERIRHWLEAYRRLRVRLERAGGGRLVTALLALRGTAINADHAASAHAGPMPRPAFAAETVLAGAHVPRRKLAVYQRAAAKTAGSAVLTAPTGSGKTEAALLWAARQAETPTGLPRLFYALPFQASMNAMRARLAASFPPGGVGLQHGRSLLALYRILLDGDGDAKRAERLARHARDLAKLNYPPVRVLSPYQMLKAMYRLKGYEAQLSDYHGAAFVYDEIHAYEPGRMAMILGMTRYLAREYGAHFLVMTATMPALVRERVQDALSGVPEVRAGAGTFRRFRRHLLNLLDGELLEPRNLALIEGEARRGKSVLVVCTWVDRAQEAFTTLDRVLTPLGIRVELLHGRFNMRDRSEKERILREQQSLQGVVLVATQVVEVSLNIDFDTIFTEPAPLEATLQRFGRVNRRGRIRPVAPVHVFRQPSDGQGIYDADVVQAALAVLEEHRGRPVDEAAVTDWLDTVYGGAVGSHWQAEYDHSAREFEATCLRTMRPFQSDERLEDAFYKAFDSIEVLPKDLYDLFMATRERSYLEADELLVPISYKRFFTMKGKGLVYPREKDMPPLVDATYGPRLGLVFERRPTGTEAFGEF